MKAIPQMNVTLVFRKGTLNEYRLPITAARDDKGNLTANMIEDNPDAHAYLNNNAEEVLQQINAAFRAAGHEVPEAADKLMDLGSPIRKNDPRLSPSFLTILVACARSVQKPNPHETVARAIVEEFVRDVFELAGLPIPANTELAPFPVEGPQK